MARAAWVLLTALFLGTARAQFPDLSQIPGLGDIGDMLKESGINLPDFSDPALQANMEKCGTLFETSQAGVDACANAAEAAAAGGAMGCPAECKAFLESLPDECFKMMSSFMPSTAGDLGASVRAACSGQPGPQIVPPGPALPTPNITAMLSSAFECDAAAGFSWVTLNASLASMSGGGGGAGAALNSTCRALNGTGCCAQPPRANLTWAQFGLGAPMEVQGVKLTAPEGQCTSAEGGAGPCWERLLSSWVLVGNASVQEVLASPEWTEAAKSLALLNATGVGDDLEAARDSWLFGQLQASSAFCNLVTNPDLFDEGAADGAVKNNGTASIGCGLGAAGGKSMAGLAAALGAPVPEGGSSADAGLAVEKPMGSWLLLARLGEDDPLAVCGVQVCAKPANATTPSA